MSQSDWLNDAELREHLTKVLGIKIDRDALAKPTPDFVFDLYNRFLLHLNIDLQSQCKDSKIIKIMMVENIRTILSSYNVEMSPFTIYDILNPNRKRTLIVVNILLFYKLEFDDQEIRFQEEKEEREAEQQVVEQIHRDLNDKKTQLEERAYEYATVEDEITRFSSETQDDVDLLAKIKLEGDGLDQEYQSFKSALKLAEEELDRDQSRDETARKELSEAEQILQNLEELRDLRVADMELHSTCQTEEDDYKSDIDRIKELKHLGHDLEKLNTHNQNIKDDYSGNISKSIKIAKKISDDASQIEPQRDSGLADKAQVLSREASLQKQITEKDELAAKILIQHKIEENQQQREMGQIETRCLNETNTSQNEINQLRKHKELTDCDISDESKKMSIFEANVQMHADKINSRINSLRKMDEESRQKSQIRSTAIREFRSKFDSLLGRMNERPSDGGFDLEQLRQQVGAMQAALTEHSATPIAVEQTTMK